MIFLNSTGRNTENLPVLLEVKELKKIFSIERGYFWKRKVGEVKAVDKVSFTLRKGETLGVVGESGCGKSTLARTLVSLYKPDSGSIKIHTDRGGGKTLPRIITMVFQDSKSSLPPHLTLMATLIEVLKVHNIEKPEKRYKIVKTLLSQVGLSIFHSYRYPHELSGGELQRACIARALAIRPEIIILDEPVSALDITTRASIINLLIKLQREFSYSYIFIAHDLSTVQKICHRVAVMYLGKIVEIGLTRDVFQNPLHPYTEALISSILIPDPEVKREPIKLQGEPPVIIEPLLGCRFVTRCIYATRDCVFKEPKLVLTSTHKVACHYTMKIKSRNYDWSNALQNPNMQE